MPPTKPSSISRSSETQAARPLIWLIEDEELIGRLLEDLLSSKGYDICWFKSGEEALSRCVEGGKPDCLITDITLPGVSGLETAQVLTAAWQELPVLVISAYIFGGELLEEPLPLRFEYLPKPFSPRALLARLVEMVPLPRS
jgi:DNA-binding response OmpR family regulator